MSDIFISYKREDQATARKLADALEKQGWSVWWDPKLRAGEHFDDVIERALKNAKCVIVLWSKLSVESRYVKDEASYALKRHKLVPVIIEDVSPPFRFEGLHAERLDDWDGTETFPAFQKLVADIAAILGAPSEQRQAEEDKLVPAEPTKNDISPKEVQQKIVNSLFEPRSYFGMAVMIFALTSLPFALLISWLMSIMEQIPFAEMLPRGLGAGAVFGLFMGVTMGFLFRAQTMRLGFTNSEEFIGKLNVTTAGIGYHLDNQTSDFLTYKPSVSAGLLAGKISVQVHDREAAIVGPKIYVSKLIKHLAD